MSKRSKLQKRQQQDTRSKAEQQAALKSIGVASRTSIAGIVIQE